MSDGKLPIEPLDDSAWRRIEERVVADPPPVVALAPPPAPPRRWLGVVALAVACVALAATLWPHDETPAVATTRVVTDETASVVRLGEVTLDVGPRSTLLAVGSDASGWELVLSRGVVRCSVPRREGRPAFVVLVDDVRVEAVGTHFTVQRDPELAVRVTRGVVRVVVAGERLYLHSGERWPVEVPTESAGPAATSPSARLEPIEPPGAPDEPPVRTPYDAQAEFDRASRLESSAPDRADAAYARVQRAGGPWGANALFARGRLAAERGHWARARAHVTRYLRLHPHGMNARDAHRLLEELEEDP